MRLLFIGALSTIYSAVAIAQSVTTYTYDAQGRLTAVRSGIGVRSDYGLDAAYNRTGYHSAQQFPNAWSAPSLPHRIEYADGGGWAVNAGQSDFLTYGRYTNGVPVGNHTATATWRILVDNNSADNGHVLTLDVWDSSAGQSLGSIQVTRQQWAAPWAYQVFELPFTMGSAGHYIEFRTYVNGISYVRIDKVGYY